MDENYLDQLLKNVEGGAVPEDEMDFQELPTSDAGITEAELEQTLAADAEHIQDVAWADSEIPVEEIPELDQLDAMADLDINSMDFDDIDFDDIDVTKMNVTPVQIQSELEDLSELSIDETYLDEAEDEAFEQEFQRMMEGKEELDMESEDDVYIDTLSENPTPLPEAEPLMEPETPMEPEPAADNMDLDSLINEVFSDSDAQEEHSENQEAMVNTDTAEMESQGADSSGNENMDELFAMLGIEGNPEATASIPETDEIPDFEIPPELADVPDISEGDKKKKKSFLDILFGDDEEDEVLTPEQEAEIARKKEEKLQAKLEKKEEKKNKKAENDAKKKSEKESKSAQLAAKKAARKAEDEKILAEDGPDKKLNKVLVALVMIFFFAIGSFVIAGTTVFDYALSISRTASYFERQKYGMAYREILGVKVKEKDQELEDKVYTVMYVERQYEAYENYANINRADLALDALVQGLGKYDEYYEDAVELGIADDINTAREKIVQALMSVYGMSVEDAYAMLQLDASGYTQQILTRSEGISFLTETE